MQTDPLRRDRRALCGAVTEVNIQASEGFEIARIFQTAGIDRCKARARNQRRDHLFGRAVVTRIRHLKSAASKPRQAPAQTRC